LKVNGVFARRSVLIRFYVLIDVKEVFRIVLAFDCGKTAAVGSVGIGNAIAFILEENLV